MTEKDPERGREINKKDKKEICPLFSPCNGFNSLPELLSQGGSSQADTSQAV